MMINSIRDRRINELLEGRADVTGTRRGRVDAFLGELRAVVRAEPMPVATGRLATLLRDGRGPLQLVAPLAPLAPARRAAPIGRRARVAALIAAGTTMVSSTMAVAGALPAPIQRTAANLGAKIGIELPGAPRNHRVPTRPTPTRRTPAHKTQSSTTTITAPRPASTPSSTAPPSTVTTPTTPSTPTVPTIPPAPVLPTLPTIPTLPTLPTVPPLPLP